MNALNRRSFLQSMALTPFLPSLLASANASTDKPRSMILVWMDGGMSHLDTFDCKPEASPDIRGDLGIVRSSLDGVFVSEYLPKLAKRMDQFSLVRSITSPEGNHDRGSHYMLTGRRPSPVLEYPSFGSVFSLESKLRQNPIPPYIAIPDAHPYARQGFLPLTHGPFELQSDPSRPEFKVRDLDPHPQMTEALEFLKTIDSLDGKPRSRFESARDNFMDQARRLSLSDEMRNLFDLGKERQETRNEYGRHFLGQSCLLARRLVQGGVNTVLVRYTGWDHHVDIVKSMTYGFPPKLPAMDQAISALFDDLRNRGMLESTLVMVASEFGRTPRINPSGGRDHWSRASSVLLYGAGLRPGTVHGTTDVRGEEPAENPVSPQDLFYTVLTALNADTNRMLTTEDGRPIRLVDTHAKRIDEILA